jgi:putative endonuclease
MSTPSSRARASAAHEAGARAEALVAAHVAASGVEVLARNVRVGRLEIDLLARDGPVLIVVEVRTRGPSAYARALDSVDARKQERLRRAAERLWQARFRADPTLERVRFDVAAVDLSEEGSPRIEIVRGAF